MRRDNVEAHRHRDQCDRHRAGGHHHPRRRTAQGGDALRAEVHPFPAGPGGEVRQRPDRRPGRRSKQGIEHSVRAGRHSGQRPAVRYSGVSEQRRPPVALALHAEGGQRAGHL